MRPKFYFSFVFLSFFTFVSCGVDEDLFLDTVLDENGLDPVNPANLRTFGFLPLNDLYAENNSVKNQAIIRLEEERRTGYLQYDLSSLPGEITKVNLNFAVSSDSGFGELSIFISNNVDWEEMSSASSLPQSGDLVAVYDGTYKVGDSLSIPLDIDFFNASLHSLILKHSDGNDFAIASSENQMFLRPTLSVEYIADPSSNDNPSNPEEYNEENSNADGTEENSGEENSEEENSEEETNLEGNLLFWVEEFEKAWVKDVADIIELSESRNDRQQYYFLSYSLEGLLQIWQATGNNRYLETALEIIENTLDDAVPMSGRNQGYLGWPSDEGRYGTIRFEEGTVLWESFYFRVVTSLLRVMKNSPSIMANADFQSRYDRILDFTLTHIWEKWYNRGGNQGAIYRENVHMTSHWARIAMELYLITGESNYLDVFNNISFAGQPNNGISIDDRIVLTNNSLYWYKEWEKDDVQDVNHGDEVLTYLVMAYENDMLWNNEYIDRLVNAFTNTIWVENNPIKFTENVDGSGSIEERNSWNHGFLMLGRFDSSLQERIRTYYNSRVLDFQHVHALGIAALNEKILQDESPFFPE